MQLSLSETVLTLPDNAVVEGQERCRQRCASTPWQSSRPTKVGCTKCKNVRAAERKYASKSCWPKEVYLLLRIAVLLDSEPNLSIRRSNSIWGGDYSFNTIILGIMYWIITFFIIGAIHLRPCIGCIAQSTSMLYACRHSQVHVQANEATRA